MLKKQIKLKIKEESGNSTVFIRPETYETSRLMKIAYAQAYRDLLSRGVDTKSSMLDALREQGLWTEKHENEITNLSLQIAMLESNLLKDNVDDTKQKELVIEISKLRRKMIDLINIKSEPLAYVAESIAEEIMQEKFLVASTFYENGKAYFKDYEDFKIRRYDINTEKILETFYRTLSEPSTKLFLDFPENKWLLKKGMMTKDGDLVDDEVKTEINVEEVNKEINGS